MSLLDTVIKKPVPSAPKGIIYGGAGIGKTTLMASASDSLIIDCENGAGQIPCVRTPYLESWEEIREWLTEIETGKHNHKVVAIDTIDWLVRRMEENVTGVDNGQLGQTLNKAHGGYGNGKSVLKNHIYRVLLPMLDRIVNRGIAVVLLAHAKRTDITDVEGVSVEKTTADLPNDFLNTFVEWSDFVYLAKKSENGERVLVTNETFNALAKNRYGITGDIKFTWDAFIGSIEYGLKAKFKK